VSALQGTITLQLQSQSVVTNSNSAEQALKRVQGAAKDTGKEVEFSAKKAGLAMTGLVTNIASATFAYKNLGDMQLTVDKANRKLEEANQRLAKVQNDAKASAQDLADAQRDVRIASEGYAQSLDKVQEAQIMFALNMGTMAVTTIPAVITAMKGLNLSTLTFSKILDVIQKHPVFLAVTAGILLWEFGISKLIKNYNGLDLSIQGNISKLTDQMFATDQATDSMNNYGSSIANVGTISETTVTKLEKSTKAIKENSDMVSFWSKINEEALKKNDEIAHVNQKQIDMFAELFKRQELFQANQEILEQRALAIALQQGYRNFAAERNFKSAGIQDVDPRIGTLMSIASQNVTAVFDRLRSLGLINTSERYHGNIGPEVAAIPRTLAASLINNGRTGSTGSVSGSSKARRGGFGGAKAGWGVQEVVKPFEKAIAGLSPAQQELALLGVNISLPSFNLESMVRGYKSPSNEFLQTSIRQATAQYEIQLAEFHRKVAEAKERLISPYRGLGFSDATVLSMLKDPSGVNDLQGMALFKKLGALAA